MTSSSQHPAENHDLISVQGARVNNPKDVSVEIQYEASMADQRPMAIAA